MEESIVNIIAADDLVAQGARASADMLLTYFFQNILTSTPQEFWYFPNNCLKWFQSAHDKNVCFKNIFYLSEALEARWPGLITFPVEEICLISEWTV